MKARQGSKPKRKDSGTTGAPAKQFDTIFIHAGLPKTGSTYLQNAMHVLSRAELLHEVAYPILDAPDDFSRIGSGNGIYASELMLNPVPEAELRPRLEDCVGHILRANDSKAANLLISSEQFFFATVDGFRCFTDILRRHARRLVLVAAVRPLKEWTFSVYVQRVKGNGQVEDYDAKWLKNYCNYSFLQCFRNLDAFDTEAIVIPYQETGLLARFLESIGEDARLAARVPEVRVNRSLGRAELELIRMVSATFHNAELSKTISDDLVKRWPEVPAAGFPAEAEDSYHAFAADFARHLQPLQGPLLGGIKEILFSEPAAASKDAGSEQGPQDPRYMFELALQNISRFVGPLMREVPALEAMRKFAREMEPSDDFFDPLHYMLMYPDIARPGVDPWWHYQTHGRKEGRKSTLVPKRLKR